MLKGVLTFIFGFMMLMGFSQPQVGSWRSHLPMSSFDFIDELDNKVYAANAFGILVYDREDGSTQSLSKLNVLTQTGISCFSCSQENGLCIAGYEDGNLDIINSFNEVTNQPAIKTANVIGDKEVRHVSFDGNRAYLFTGVGVLEMNLATYDILEYSKLSFQGEDMFLFAGEKIDNIFFFANRQGIFKQDLNSAFNTPDPVQLEFEGQPNQAKQFIKWNDEVYLLTATSTQGSDTLYQLIGDQFVLASTLNDLEIRWLDIQDDRLLVTSFKEVYEFNQAFDLIRTIDRFWAEPGMDARRALYSKTTGEIVVADAEHGCVISNFDAPENSEVISLSSPKGGQPSVLKEHNGVIYALTGGNDFTFNVPFMHQLKNEEWSSTLTFTEDDISIRNLVDVAVYENKKYLGFDLSGYMVLNNQNEVLEFFNEANTETIDDPDGYYGVRGIEIDEDGNVWMLNNRSTSTLSLRRKNGTWTNFSIPGFVKPIVDHLTLLSNGMLAFSVEDNGFILYDPGDTPVDQTDDRFVNINSSPTAGNLNSNTVYCITEDLDGELWIGTEEGVAIVFNPDNAFDPNFSVQKVIVNQDGYNGYLFETDAVISIVIDGTNRKWVAPRGAGLFLVSAEGQFQLEHFTQDNSPLLDDNIEDLVLNPKTGELFIATESGLLSYRSDASEPKETLEAIKVFPNPVKPGFNGVITFSQLTSDAYVRVTNTAGMLVFETQSRGGTATWDGNDQFGQRVPSGVYLIYAATRDGLTGTSAKLLFLD